MSFPLGSLFLFVLVFFHLLFILRLLFPPSSVTSTYVLLACFPCAAMLPCHLPTWFATKYSVTICVRMCVCLFTAERRTWKLKDFLKPFCPFSQFSFAFPHAFFPIHVLTRNVTPLFVFLCFPFTEQQQQPKWVAATQH